MSKMAIFTNFNLATLSCFTELKDYVSPLIYDNTYIDGSDAVAAKGRVLLRRVPAEDGTFVQV